MINCAAFHIIPHNTLQAAGISMEPRTRRRRPRTASSHRRIVRAFVVVAAALALDACCSIPAAEATDRPMWAVLSQPNRVTSTGDQPAFSSFPIDWAFINAGAPHACND